MKSQIQVTLVANAGLLLRYRETTILLDALIADGEYAYCAPSEVTRQKILRGDPPFEQIDYVMFSHLHADHFSELRTREFLERRRVKGLLLPYAEELERKGFFDFVKDSGTPCFLLTEHAGKAIFRLSPEIQVTAVRTLHLDRKYHDIPHFCYLIAFGEKKLLFTSDVDYTEEDFAFLREEQLRAVFVNPLFFSDLHRRRFFRGAIPADRLVVYHMPFPESEAQLQRMLSRELLTWEEEGAEPVVLSRELETIIL